MRAAYEEARSGVRRRREEETFVPPDPGPAGPSLAETPGERAVEDPAPARSNEDEAWTRYRSGDRVGALALLETRFGAEPRNATLVLDALEMLHDEEADPAVRLVWWERGLEAGIDVSRQAGQLDASYVAGLSAAGALSWSVVRAQPDADFAVELWHYGQSLACDAGRHAEVLGALEDPILRGDGLAFPSLVECAWNLLERICWNDVDGSERVFADYGGSVEEWSPSLERLEVALMVAREWDSIRGETDAADLLTRLFERRPRTREGGEALRRELAASFDASPATWSSLVDALAKKAPMVSRRFGSTVDAMVELDDRLWDELDGFEQDWIGREIRELNTLLDKNPYNTFLTFAFGFGFIAWLASFFVLGGWAMLLLVPAFVLLVVVTRASDAYLYANVLRPALIDRLVSRGVGADWVLEAISIHIGSWTEDLGRFDGEISEDGSLDLLAALYRLGADAEDVSEEGLAFDGGYRFQARELADDCRDHPGVPRESVCTSCGKEVCADCHRNDEFVGPFCLDCDHERFAARRRHGFEAEARIRAVAGWIS